MTAPLETYLAELQWLRLTGVATEEISYYPPLQNLLNEIGRTLKPKVFCLSQPKNAGAGRPDFYLYTAGQLPKATTRKPVPDAPPTDPAFWSDARATMPSAAGKEPITLRIDRDTVKWFKARGHGYQTRMNAVLRAYMLARKKASGR